MQHKATYRTDSFNSQEKRQRINNPQKQWHRFMATLLLFSLLLQSCSGAGVGHRMDGKNEEIGHVAKRHRTGNILPEETYSSSAATSALSTEPSLSKALLFYKEAKANKQTRYESPLIAACILNNSDIVSCLLCNNANIALVSTESGNTPLITACETKSKNEKCTKTVSLLIKKKANLSSRNKLGNTPLHAASRKLNLCRNSCYRNLGTATLLLNTKADVNAQNINGETSLMTACENPILRGACKKFGSDECEKIVTLLIDHKANLNSTNILGNTALHATFREMQCSNYIAATLLINAKADVNARNINGDIPIALFLGKRRGTTVECEREAEIVKLLLEAKSDTASKDNKGGTLLNKALRDESYKSTVAHVSALLLAGASVNEKGEDGMPPLILASMLYGENGRILLKLLLDSKADVNTKNNVGDTALIKVFRSADGYRTSEKIREASIKEKIELLLEHHRESPRALLPHRFGPPEGTFLPVNVSRKVLLNGVKSIRALIYATTSSPSSDYLLREYLNLSESERTEIEEMFPRAYGKMETAARPASAASSSSSNSSSSSQGGAK